jgi:hypothetical protein
MTTTVDLADRAVPASVRRMRRQAQLAENLHVLVVVRRAALQPAVTLTAIEHRALPGILAAALPAVTHFRRQVSALSDEHLFIEQATGEAVRVVLTFDQNTGRTSTEIGEAGGCLLWERLVIRCTEWEMAGRQIPEGWAA